jgi:hypothetical protein
VDGLRISGIATHDSREATLVTNGIINQISFMVHKIARARG